MKIDLNDENSLTIENIAKLIASKDDSQHRQLRVTKNGMAFISDDVGATKLNGIPFRLCTWSAGNDYVGEAAAQDHEHNVRIYNCLKENWPNPKSTYIEFY